MSIKTLILVSSAIASTTAFNANLIISSRSKPSMTLASSLNNNNDNDSDNFDQEPPMTTVGDEFQSTGSGVMAINGWTPDAYLPCYGLPGALAPTGFFDPLGFAQKGISLDEIKRNREAEVMHGRVAMVAAVGYLAGESTSGPFHIVGPANDQLQQMPAPAFAFLTIAIAAAELKRATVGWIEPDFSSWTKTLWKLRDNYYPGDIGFDPLGFKPSDPVAFSNMQTRELQNGRLAMLGVAGMCAQELVNHRTIMETIEFYQKVYSGENPYAYCGAADAIIC